MTILRCEWPFGFVFTMLFDFIFRVSKFKKECEEGGVAISVVLFQVKKGGGAGGTRFFAGIC